MRLPDSRNVAAATSNPKRPGTRISSSFVFLDRTATFARQNSNTAMQERGPIVALQRRVRFSARLAGFCRIRWH